MNEREFNELVGDVKDIKNALIGTGTHKGQGLLDRVSKLEKNQDNGAKIIGAVGAAGAVIGSLITWAFKILHK